MEIDEIRVIVCEGQNLKGKKKDHCRASVIFGIGNDKFRTTIVDEPSGNVAWNEEQTFDTRAHLVKPIKSVTNSPSPQPLHRPQFVYKPLIFTVKDKERVIGRVTQAVDKLSTTRKKYRCPIIPPEHSHASELGAGGAATTPYLVYECWITKYRASPAPTSKNRSESELSDLERIKSKTSSLTRGGGLPLDNGAGHRRQMSSSSSNASSTLPRRQTMGKTALITSVKSFFGTAPPHNGGSFREARQQSPSPVDGSNPFEPSLPNSSTNDSLNNVCQSAAAPIIEPDGLGPVITGISPMQGPTTGGTKITIRGQALGRDQNDIMGVYVCGVDCSATLQYHSPSKITLVTPSGSPVGTGEILLVTRSGGASRCTVKYRFYHPDHENEVEEEEKGRSLAELLPQSSDDTPLQSSSALLSKDEGASNYCYGGLYYLDLLKRQTDNANVNTNTHGSSSSPICNTNVNLDKIMLSAALSHPRNNGISAPPTQMKPHKTALSESKELNDASELSTRSAPRHFRRFKTTALDTYENCSRESLLKEVYSLRRHVEDLMTENKLMRYYVDTLVLRVMEVCPEHLEKSQYKSTR